MNIIIKINKWIYCSTSCHKWTNKQSWTVMW